MENFKNLFEGQRTLFLENVNYETNPKGTPPGMKKLGCRDTLVSQLINNVGIKIIFNRRISFEPDAMFTLSVSFGVMLRFNEEGKETDFKEVNIVGEFTKNYPDLMADLTARASLLIGQITSSAGGSPLVTPTTVKLIKEKSEG